MSKMNIDFIKQFQERPVPFTPGEPLFWDDPHISTQMLKAHLNPDNDLASRRPQTIQKSVDWLIASLDLQVGDSVLDLGCGPGLYAARLAEQGLHVTGVDYSRRSIEYATEFARQSNLDIRYRYQDYLTLDDEGEYDAALLIYGDYCPLAPEQRKVLLTNIQRAFKPGGYFVLDVTTPIHHKRHGSHNGWYAVETGFWKPGPHLVLEEGFDYSEQSIYLDQAVVIEESGMVSVYRNWFQDFTRETITAELEAGGFAVQSVWNDLFGTPFTEDTEWIGILARKE
jgi:SAM-dependent methyltransferase